jgi:large subunit ribosomal protein L30
MTMQLQIKQVKSIIGRLPKHVLIMKQLGLGKMNRTVVHSDTPSIRGLINIVSYMVQVEELKS